MDPLDPLDPLKSKFCPDLLVGPDCGNDFQPGRKPLDVSGQEGSQCVAVIRPVELCLIKPINQHYQPGLLHMQLPLWRERKNNSSTDGGLVSQAAHDRISSDLCRECPAVLVFLSGGLCSDPECMSAD